MTDPINTNIDAVDDAVDETPISPVRRPNHQRTNSLQNHLQNRPERSELVDSMSPDPARGPRVSRPPTLSLTNDAF